MRERPARSAKNRPPRRCELSQNTGLGCFGTRTQPVPMEDRKRVENYEKLGAFYLGRNYDLERGEVGDELLLYDAKDLTTHAVCVGMTGSGKTGLCVTLLEEAAIDGIPALIIDPKGDLGNLMLTFPQLRPEHFGPWIDADEAARKERTPEEHARATAELWRKGLSSWSQDGSRIARFREAAEVAIYTPGSSAGLPLSVLRSFAAPPPVLAADADALRERILAAVSGLLALLGIAADPIRSREHILLSTLLDHAWRAQRDLDLPTLIREIQSPAFERVGIEREKDQYDHHKLQTAISIGATVLGALFGRKLGSVGRATTAARGAGRAARERTDVARAREDLEALRRRLADLEEDCEQELAGVRGELDPESLEYDQLSIRPRKTDLNVGAVNLVWTP
jgi:hypothetical protein